MFRIMGIRRGYKGVTECIKVIGLWQSDQLQDCPFAHILGVAAGDVGFVRSDDTATGVTLREYWSNKDTALLSDLPHEASLAPNLWGLFRYEPAPEAAPEATPEATPSP